MFHFYWNSFRSVIVALSFAVMFSSAYPQTSHPFELRDDIALSHFGAVLASPNNKWLLVQSERASVEDDSLHETIRVYAVDEIRTFLKQARQKSTEPIWTVDEVVPADGFDSTGLSHLEWLDDSSGFAFLLRTDPYKHRLYLADCAKHALKALSPLNENVLGFDIRDASHYVFTAVSQDARERLLKAAGEPFRVGTGGDLDLLVNPDYALHSIGRADLWAAVGGSPNRITDLTTHEPIELFTDGNLSLSLSPDGRSLLTLKAVGNVPDEWVRRFPPPYPDSPYALKPHNQDLYASSDYFGYISEWVRIDLTTGHLDRLTHAPEARRIGWWEVYELRGKWSDDGSAIVLPQTYWDSKKDSDSRPCILVVAQGRSECVKPLDAQLKNGREPGFQPINKIAFVPHRDDEIDLTYVDEDGADVVSRYHRRGDGRWDKESTFVKDARSSVQIKTDESYRQPPKLIAIGDRNKRPMTILDLNPQLSNVQLGEPELYNWSDATGRAWTAILYKPIGYDPAIRYPLVIQTHGYSLNRFVPSGAFGSAFAAQEFASAGIMVLQMRQCASVEATPFEAQCNVMGFESAVTSLARDGRIDPRRVGIIGFSRTVYHVLAALTTSKIHFTAASITDGVTFGYTNFLGSIRPEPSLFNESLAIYGAEPIGEGLSEWTKRSPVFNLSAVTAPVRIVSRRASAIVDMWEPYALLEVMRRPVDFVVLNTDQHIVVDPKVRLESQGGNIDWFRFWLQGYEDPDPHKASEYQRWRALRENSVPRQQDRGDEAVN